jgi:hypothetical protein
VDSGFAFFAHSRKNVNTFSFHSLRQTFDYFCVPQKVEGLGLLLQVQNKIDYPADGLFYFGRGERTQTFDLPVPNRARYQLRHTPMVFYLLDYTLFAFCALVAFMPCEM